MPKLTAVALVNDVTLQDPYPTNDKLVIKLPADPASPIYVETEVSRAQLERLTPQMEGLESSGLIRWNVTAGEGDERSEEFGYEGLPMLSWIDIATTPWTIVAGVSGGVVEGVNLLGGQVKDHVLFGDADDPLNHLDLQLLTADVTQSGSHLTGGFFTFSIVSVASPGDPVAVKTYTPATGGNPYNPAFTPAIIEMEVEFGVHSWKDLATVMNAASPGLADIVRTADAAAAVTKIAQAYGPTRSSGLLNGAGHSLTVGGVPADIVFIDDTTLEYDVAAATLPGAAGDYAVMDLRTNNKLASLTAILAA